MMISLVLAGCSVFSVHRIDVRQGNALKERDVKQLELGMNPEQVTICLAILLSTTVTIPIAGTMFIITIPAMARPNNAA